MTSLDEIDVCQEELVPVGTKVVPATLLELDSLG